MIKQHRATTSTKQTVAPERRISRRQMLAQSAAATLAINQGVTGWTADEPRGQIRTVLGSVAPDELGVTLMHEHVPIVDWSELYETPAAPFAEQRAEMIATSVRLLSQFQQTVPQQEQRAALVECTPIRVGRYPRLLAEIADQAGVHLIACTGFWGEGLAPAHPWATKMAFEKRGVQKIADLYIREVTEGMEDPAGKWGERFTAIKAGIIKCATSTYLRPVEKRCHQAAAIASRNTGCPITTHTTNGGGLEQVRLLMREGVSPEKIIIGHQGNQDDRENADAHEYHRQLVATGCTIQFDRIGGKAYSVEKTARQIKRLVDAGFAGQILVSHDTAPYVYKEFSVEKKTASGWQAESADFTIVTAQLIPALQKLDVAEADIRAILVENPRRVLTF